MKTAAPALGTTGGSRWARRRWIIASVAGVVLAGAAFVLWYFQPQAALINHRVDQALPSAAAPPAPASAVAGSVLPAVPAAPTTLRRGSFQSLAHPSSGRALVVQLPDGSRLLRLEDLSTSNGPDVHVILSPVPAGTDDHAYSSDFLELGNLQGNEGNQNYPVPTGTDLSQYRSAVIYCKRFTVGFAVAGLSP